MSKDVYKIALTEKTQVAKRTLHESNYMRRIALPSLVEDYDSLFKEIQQYVTLLPEDIPANHIENMFDFMRRSLNKSIWVERTGASLDFLPRWKKMWPNAKFIHIYRDGRNSSLSMSKNPAFKQQIIRTRKNRSVTWYNIIPLDPDSFTIEEFRAVKIPLEEYGKLWNTMIMKGLDELDEIPSERLLNLSYESLIDNPRYYLTQLINFIDPELESENWIKSQIKLFTNGKSDWTRLPKTQQIKLNQTCKKGLKRLNYI